MKIEILGTGCPKCRQMAEVVRKAVERSGKDAAISKVEDVREISKWKVMATPALAIDDEVKIAGRVPTVEEVTSLLTP
ncbi:MAG: thioredoxin family protein [Candidatus Deferrimicrobiaceae bacterium]